MKNTKAQIKMLETIMVLVMFFFLVAMGLKFYGNIQLQELQKTQTEFERLDSVKVANLVMTLPELSCTSFNEFEGSCVDYHKAIAWSSLSEVIKLNNYIAVFGETTISLELLYPQARISDSSLYPNTTVVIYDNPPQNIRNSIVTQIPVVIYNGMTKTNEFGLLEVTTYQINV